MRNSCMRQNLYVFVSVTRVRDLALMDMSHGSIRSQGGEQVFSCALRSGTVLAVSDFVLVWLMGSSIV